MANTSKNNWDSETGDYRVPSLIWDVDRADELGEEPDDWLSRPGGDHFVAMSFHFAPYTFPAGSAESEGRFQCAPTPYALNIRQDPYNSWGVVARLKSRLGLEPLQFWDWLPGVLIVDTSVRFTLPNPMLAAYAGTEWADNDYRIFCGFADVDWYLTMRTSFIEQMNRLTGPGWAGWPYGVRQLHEALVGWIKPGAELPEIVLLASVRQSGSKITALDTRLYNPGPTLGAWNSAPATWDCRQAARFLYHAKLMIGDGLPDMAVTTAISALENAIAEVLRFKLADPNRADPLLRRTKFLSRFKKLLPQYGVTLPKSLAKPIKPAYLARNEIAHGASAIGVESAAEHVANIEEAIVWLWANVD